MKEIDRRKSCGLWCSSKRVLEVTGVVSKLTCSAKVLGWYHMLSEMRQPYLPYKIIVSQDSFKCLGRMKLICIYSGKLAIWATALNC